MQMHILIYIVLQNFSSTLLQFESPSFVSGMKILSLTRAKYFYIE